MGPDRTPYFNRLPWPAPPGPPGRSRFRRSTAIAAGTCILHDPLAKPRQVSPRNRELPDLEIHSLSFESMAAAKADRCSSLASVWYLALHSLYGMP